MKQMPLFASERQVLEGHKRALLANHEGEYVLIYKDRILGCFPTRVAALNYGWSEVGFVSFLVRQLVE